MLTSLLHLDTQELQGVARGEDAHGGGPFKWAVAHQVLHVMAHQTRDAASHGGGNNRRVLERRVRGHGHDLSTGRLNDTKRGGDHEGLKRRKGRRRLRCEIATGLLQYQLGDDQFNLPGEAELDDLMGGTGVGLPVVSEKFLTLSGGIVDVERARKARSVRVTLDTR